MVSRLFTSATSVTSERYKGIILKMSYVLVLRSTFLLNLPTMLPTVSTMYHVTVHHPPLVHHAAPVHHAPAVVHQANYNYDYDVAESYSGLTLAPLKSMMDMLTSAYTMSIFPMVVPTLLHTLLEMISPDMLPVFNTLVNPHLMLLHLPPMFDYLK